jgi:hypothetical protein
MSPNSNPEEDVQIGIVSYSFPEERPSPDVDPQAPPGLSSTTRRGCDPRTPRVATRVSYFYEWFVKPWIDHQQAEDDGINGSKKFDEGKKDKVEFNSPTLTPIKEEIDTKLWNQLDSTNNKQYYPIYAIGSRIREAEDDDYP